MRGQGKLGHPGLSRGVVIHEIGFDYYLRESGSEVFFGDFWLR